MKSDSLLYSRKCREKVKALFVNEQCKLPLQKVRHYNFSKHHVVPGYQSDSIIEVARDLVGLHSARLSTPYVTLCSRVNDFQTKDLRDHSFISRKLVRVRCMRRTLHTVPLDLAAIVHQSTLSFRVADCLRIYHQLGVPSPLIEEVSKAITHIVRNEPATSEQIQEIIQREDFLSTGNQMTLDEHRKFVRTVIKHLWEDGALCYINLSEHWGAEKRVYGYTPQLYPEINLQALTPNEAQKYLVYYHIDRFGPVTETDICWWSGLGREIVRKCIFDLRNRLFEVRMEGFDHIFYMTVSDFENFQTFKPTENNWLCLLAYEDPSLKGYFESRSRYIASQHYDTLFNQIGEARASIIANGAVIGIWFWDKCNQKVVWDTFESVDDDFIKLLEEACFRLENCLNEGVVQIRLL
jgi:hypothetical protein